MIDLFDKVEAQKIIERIQLLNNNSKALWGKMQVAQMLLHCQAPLKVAFDELNIQRSWLGFFFGKIAKKIILQDKPFPRNLPTVAEFEVKTTCDFEKEKNGLIDLVDRFSRSGSEAFHLKKHPFFGTMTSDEWSFLQWKHLDHHLQQFGV